MHFLILFTTKWALIEVTPLAFFFPWRHCLHAWWFLEYRVSWVYHAAGMIGIKSSCIESMYICNFLWDFTAKTRDISTRSPNSSVKRGLWTNLIDAFQLHKVTFCLKGLLVNGILLSVTAFCTADEFNSGNTKGNIMETKHRECSATALCRKNGR